MIRCPHQFHLERIVITTDNTNAAAIAFFRIDGRLQFLAPLYLDHVDGVEQATVDAVLANGAIVLYVVGYVAALGPDLADIKAGGSVNGDSFHAAVTAALAGYPDALHS